MTQKSVLLILTGSIAAYKSLDVIRQLREENVHVTCVMTRSAEKFVTPLSVAGLAGNKVYTDLFSLTDESEMGHIRLSRECDLVVVAPATADILAKMSTGLADDLASTLLLATDRKVMVAPAMNVKMWENSATQRNVRQLQADGVQFIGPDKGALACGEEGFGRMADVETIVTSITQTLNGLSAAETRPLAGIRVLVTSGPTVEAIDPVRYIANRSSGKQGHAIARALADFGASVTLVSGPTTLEPPQGVQLLAVESAREMLNACYRTLPCDIAVCAAAVSDWRVANYALQKIKKRGLGEDMMFTFMENPDILECLSKHDQNRPGLVVGFAAETEQLVKHAREKLVKKGCDWILANDVTGGAVFGSDTTAIHFITRDGVEEWPNLSKVEVSERLALKIAEYVKKRRDTPGARRGRKAN